MSTAIIILNYNDSDTTLRMIKQIKKYKVLDYIVIVDNCSTDNSYEILKKEEKENIDVIKTEKNNGYASGNNYGIKYAIEKRNADYLIISNPDIIVDEKTIEKLIKELRFKNISLIAPAIKELGKISRGWKLPKLKNDLLSNINYFHKYADKDLQYNESKYKDKLTEVEVVKGCFFIIKSDVIKEIDYFDENTFLYYEENILGKKLKDKNYKSYILNNTEVKHDLSISVDKSINSLKKYKILKRSQRYYEKNYNKTGLIGIFLLYITFLISYFIAYILFIIKRIGGSKK